uniref:Metalloendopeptidase n=1 Tax=Parastrongyloides trichosuri TaxID=131310 RepID=A0A0N5A5S2_PARTI
HMFRQKIDSVLRYLERSTCLKFKESKIEVINETQLIYRPSTICQSFVKKQKYPYDNYIDLTDGCAHLFGTVAHETFHSLGLLHEHSRYDRDDYLILYKENVTLVFDTSYDYGSVMQYPNNAFSINGKDTMKARNISQYNKMMGQNSVITFNDLKLINLYYCKGECSHSQRVCKNGGYVMEPRCLHCICPKEYEGDDCSLVKDRSFKCSLEKYTAASYNRTLVAYGEKRCVFHLKASEGKKIILYLTVVRTRDRGICIADFGLEVKYLKDKGCTGLCLCGNYENIKLISEDNEIVITYTGHTSNNWFLAEFKEF